MKQFDHILNWKLLKGSHEFPGPEGGTCINEAAIVASGFEYKSVKSAEDCPPCFSRPIADYAIGLNDQMPNDVRQKLLMPFVLRLAGTADTPEVEQKRIEFIAIETFRRIIGKLCDDVLNRPDLADQCRNVKTLKDVRAARAAACAACAACAAADAAWAACAACAAADAADAAGGAPEYWTIAAQILSDAIELGRHEPLDPEIASERLDAVRKLAEVK